MVNLNLRQLNKIGKSKFVASSEHKEVILVIKYKLGRRNFLKGNNTVPEANIYLQTRTIIT